MGKPNNLLIILSDEHQARALGCAGHPFVQTPHLDALAANGVRFANAVTPCPICVPARAAFATGRYVHDIRLWDNAMPYIGQPKGWGHALQDSGVPVQSIGKLHYRDADDPTGFDRIHLPMMVAGGVGMIWGAIRQEDRRVAPPGGRMLGDYVGPGESKYTEYDRAIVARTKQWFADRAEADDATDDAAPWCLYIGLVAPHFPLIAPQEFYDLYASIDIPPPKLHPGNGYVRHPWVEKQNALDDIEAAFETEDERARAFIAYYGLCSWLDHNVGEIVAALNANGFGDNTTIVYASDHGDNVGARGLWGKSNMYDEPMTVPLIISGPEVPKKVCTTPVSLIDLDATIRAHFDAADNPATPGVDLAAIIAQDDDPTRTVFSEYHAVGAVSGGFAVRSARWKYIYYVGFAPELFDLEADPDETDNLASDPVHADQLAAMHQKLLTICDPEAVDAQAHTDQAALVASHGGLEATLNMGPVGATPPPES